MRKKTKKDTSRINLPLHLIIPAFFFLIVFLLYAHNLTRDVYSGDIGDLVTASFVFGVPHPSGYPLFTFLGFLLSRLPLALPVVTKVSFISLFASLAGLVIFYLFSLRITKNRFLALLATSILAFSYLFWSYAEIPEVFALNNLFAVAIIYFTYLFSEEKKDKYLYILALLCGLSLTHHQTIVLLFPGVLILLAKQFKYLFSSIKRLGIGVFFFLAGLLPLLYIPLAASRNPVINWDNATTFHNFINLFLRKDYGVAPALVNEVPVSVKLVHIASYFSYLLTNYSYQLLFLIVIGAFYLAFKNRWFFFSLLVSYILAGPFFIYYAAGLTGIPVGLGIIERFYTLSAVVLAFCIPYGFRTIQEFLDKRFSRPYFSLMLLCYFLIIPALMLKYNFSRTDLSTTRIGNTLADNIFSYLPEKSILFVSGDTTTFNIWYNYYVLGKRNDIGLINPPGIGGNQFFDIEINAYHKLHPQAKLSDLPSETIEALRDKRKIFSTYQIPLVPKDTAILPRGIVYEIIRKDAIPSEQTYLNDVETQLRKLSIVRQDTLTPAEDNLIAAEIPSIYSAGLTRIGDFVAGYYKDPARAENYYRRALWIDPGHPDAYAGLALVQYKAYHDCVNAPKSMKTAISLYPVWKTYYIQLYVIYRRCNTPKQAVLDFEKNYRTLFHEDIKTITKPYLKQST